MNNLDFILLLEVLWYLFLSFQVGNLYKQQIHLYIAVKNTFIAALPVIYK